jgi:hypothetical protein
MVVGPVSGSIRSNCLKSTGLPKVLNVLGLTFARPDDNSPRKAREKPLPYPAFGAAR